MYVYTLNASTWKAPHGSPPRHYGLATPAEVAGKTGREILQAIVEGKLPQPPICETLSFWIVEVGDGFAAFEGETGRHLLNPMGGVHGGWALTRIDSACGCAAHSLLPAGARGRAADDDCSGGVPPW